MHLKNKFNVEIISCLRKCLGNFFFFFFFLEVEQNIFSQLLQSWAGQVTANEQFFKSSLKLTMSQKSGAFGNHKPSLFWFFF